MPHASSIENSTLLNTHMCYLRHAFNVCGLTLYDYFLMAYNASGRFEYKSHLHPEEEKYFPSPGMHLNNIDPLRTAGFLMG
jgi:hypothetical protein